MPNVVPAYHFVAPHFIEELGEEGLTLHEIAQSLQIQFKHAKEALEKNLSDYNAVEITTQQEIQEVTGFTYSRKTLSYVLTTEDAKFFVAGYNNEVGKAYRRYLINCEKVVNAIQKQVSTTPHEKAAGIVEVYLRVANLFEVPKHYAQVEAAKEARKITGVDFSPLLRLAPAMDNILPEEVMLEPTELAEKLGLKSPRAVNNILKSHGLQEKSENGWIPTKEGEPLCTPHFWQKGTKSGYNLKWKVSKLIEILGLGDEEGEVADENDSKDFW